jgi:cytochrome c553
MRGQPFLLFTVLAITGSASAAGSPEAGKAKAAPCAACHGADGNSAAPNFPKLAGQHPNYLVKQLLDYKSGLRKNEIMNGMAAPLSEQDIEDLAAYYASQQLKVGVASKESLELGQQIYRGGDKPTGVPACMSCHGPAGSGNLPARFPLVGGQHGTYTADQLQQFKQGTRANDAAGMMRAAASKMTPEQINAVAEYMQGLY